MIIRGVGEQLVPAHLNFGKFILDRLRKTKPDVTCLISSTTGDRLTFGEFTQFAVDLSVALRRLGVSPGDTVAVAGEPRVTSMPTILAVVFAGAAFSPIELECGKAILAHKLSLIRPKYVICSRLFWDKYSDVLKGSDYIKTFISFDDVEDIKISIATMTSEHTDVATFEPAPVRGATDVAMVFYSSGTTGMSKAVPLTHLSCIARTDLKSYCGFESSQTSYFVTKLETPYSVFPIFAYLCAGKRAVYSEIFSVTRALEDIHNYQVDTVLTVPSFVDFVEAALSDGIAEEKNLISLKVIFTTSASLLPAVAEAFKQRFPDIKLLQWYGAVETFMITVQEACDTENATVGVARPGVMIKIVDVATRETLGPNQRGEICVLTPSLMKGYLGATSTYLDEQGFYLTGDIGYYDERKKFYIVDRLKDIMCYMGATVAPGDIEMVLLRHEAVREAAVVGRPAGPRGELPTAFVVLRPGARATEAELVDYVAKEVSWHMQLAGGVRFVSELPRNPRQKILRWRLREMLELEGEPSADLLKTY